MTRPAIHLHGIGKKFIIGGHRRSNSLRDSINKRLYASIRTFRQREEPNPTNDLAVLDDTIFWALRDVTFDVEHGEVVGLIGHNGAGKSTLLKLLSRITRPTEGYFEVHGRLGALLEIGTGFHPDLTGRENIFLNGSILGMKRVEIEAKFDQIVEFSGIEKFIETQVKYYSSGMYVRLAFSVAAQLETDILLLDEVLAVGDIGFQQKSHEKMKSIAKAGRAVVVVSHSMKPIQELCDRVVWMDGGRIKMIGLPGEVISAYETAMIGGSLRSDGIST
jgi:lipopolysaccharide transport system ATP-binding protein